MIHHTYISQSRLPARGRVDILFRRDEAQVVAAVIQRVAVNVVDDVVRAVGNGKRPAYLEDQVST